MEPVIEHRFALNEICVMFCALDLSLSDLRELKWGKKRSAVKALLGKLLIYSGQMMDDDVTITLTKKQKALIIQSLQGAIDLHTNLLTHAHIFAVRTTSHYQKVIQYYRDVLDVLNG